VIATRTIGFTVAGLVFGYAWHRVVGCSTGACPITANPWTAMAYGGLMGFLVAN